MGPASGGEGGALLDTGFTAGRIPDGYAVRPAVGLGLHRVPGTMNPPVRAMRGGVAPYSAVNPCSSTGVVPVKLTW